MRNRTKCFTLVLIAAGVVFYLGTRFKGAVVLDADEVIDLFNMPPGRA